MAQNQGDNSCLCGVCHSCPACKKEKEGVTLEKLILEAAEKTKTLLRNHDIKYFIGGSRRFGYYNPTSDTDFFVYWNEDSFKGQALIKDIIRLGYALVPPFSAYSLITGRKHDLGFRSIQYSLPHFGRFTEGETKILSHLTVVVNPGDFLEIRKQHLRIQEYIGGHKPFINYLRLRKNDTSRYLKTGSILFGQLLGAVDGYNEDISPVQLSFSADTFKLEEYHEYVCEFCGLYPATEAKCDKCKQVR